MCIIALMVVISMFFVVWFLIPTKDEIQSFFEYDE